MATPPSSSVWPTGNRAGTKLGQTVQPWSGRMHRERAVQAHAPVSDRAVRPGQIN